MRFINRKLSKWYFLRSSFLVGIVVLFLYLSLTGEINRITESSIATNASVVEGLREKPLHSEKQLIKESIEEWKNWNIRQDSVVNKWDLNYVQFTVKPFIWNQSCLVCLSTQSTVNRLIDIVELEGNWKGRLSVSVFVPGQEFTKAKIILWLLYHCRKLSNSQLVFHFGFKSTNQPINNLQMWKGVSLESCKNLTLINDVLAVHNEYHLYPQNSMRNIAREECNSEYVILSDNDMIPTPGLSSALEPVLNEQRSCKKCAFVIPGYECPKNISSLPKNKDQLIEMVEKKLARPYHWDYQKNNQGSHDPKRWETIRNSSAVEIAYPIQVYEFAYEPVYVAKKPLPVFDKRFIGYGFVRTSQMLEMIASGYRLYLLDNAFMIHRGIGTHKFSPKSRSREKNKNQRRFNEFAKEVLIRNGRTDIVEKMIPGSEKKTVFKYAQDIYDRHKHW